MYAKAPYKKKQTGNIPMALNDREKNLLIAALQAENRALKSDNAELYSICESLKIANAEHDYLIDLRKALQDEGEPE